ncbi:MAG: hypothetical protein ACTSVI_02730 [Promethearchaeota archaeon]
MGSFLYFTISLGIGFALGGKTTATFLPGRDKRKRKDEIYYIQDKRPEVLIDDDTGVFNVIFGPKKELKGGQPVVTFQGKKFSPLSRKKKYRLLVTSLKKKEPVESKLGKGVETTIDWVLSGTDQHVIGKIFEGTSKPFITFELIIPNGLVYSRKGKFEDPVIEFPRFINDSSNEHVLTWANEKFAPPRKKFNFSGAPVLYYDDELNAFILSSLDNFFVTGIKFNQRDNAISVGLAGSVNKVPENFSLQSILYIGNGINASLDKWGKLFREWHGFKKKNPYDTPITALLGYNTDNGAYYYYNTEKGMNYEDTMIALRKHHVKENIPIGYYELDSWWYPKSYENLPALLKIFLYGSALHWGEPPKKSVFPSGLKALWKNLDELPLMCHSRWFSPKSHYVEEYDFYIQKPSLKSFNMPLFAAPLEKNFWDDLFANAKEWGLKCYLQDWLSYQYDEIDLMKSSVEFADEWTSNMAEAASEKGMSIQYCMAPACFMMQSVKLPNVYQARASDDHNGIQPRRWYQPHFTQTSMLCKAVGLWPHKDTFFSSNKKVYWHYWEKRPEMECLTAVLSGGPVAPSDKIGNENKKLLMQTCRSDGILLKPDVPATPLDIMFKEHAKYYITSTLNEKPSGYTWYYVHLMNLWKGKVKDKTLSLEDIGLEGDFLAFQYWKQESLVLNKEKSSVSLDIEFEGQELVILCPELLEGIYLVGNPEKFVTCSNKQFKDVIVDEKSKSITIILENVPKEPIPVMFHVGEKPISIEGAIEHQVPDQEPSAFYLTANIDEKGNGKIVLRF